ncbi:substrate-binding domain-containing protein [Corynebacterium freneyi]|uniref:substrate-binding domain-containing protein n=1 Tax=Corynebacterium freneyi TaxID=134034 RepID=UPI0022B448B3|nr:substrate-binding domain-containing protein [Corynebacterium freneyi]
MADPCRIGVLVPLQGPGGIFGPSCVAASEYAKEELNAHSGIGGRRVELAYIDAGQSAEAVVAEIAALVAGNRIDALTGWHISSLRKRLVPVVRDRIPYLYTSLSEGDSRTTGVYLLGEDPEQQVFPALAWMRGHLGLRKWHVVGANYIWPLRSLQKIAMAANDLGLQIVGKTFVEMGEGGSPLLPRAVSSSGCDAALILLVGQDAVEFNRNFAALGLHHTIARFSPLMEENMLLASGAEATENLYSSASYFRTLTSQPAMDFLSRYMATQGETAPALNNMAQSCYQGIMTLAELTSHSRGFGIASFERAVETIELNGPRGRVRFRDNQALQTVHLARADGLDFDVLATLGPDLS